LKTKTVTAPPIAHDVLSRATVRGNAVVLPAGQLDRPVYEAVNKVLTAMGGKWNKKAGGHLFAFDPAPMLADALGTGKAVNRKQTLQFFETSVDLARRLALLAGVRPGHLVLEPEAGHGRLVKAAMERGADVVAVEIDPTNADVLSRIGGVEVHLDDFLKWAKHEKRRFDAVIMNPPFTGNQDIRHITAAISLLRDGGTFSAILSDHAFIGGERECVEFRGWLEDVGAMVEAVPAGAFKESGTNISARIISGIKFDAKAKANARLTDAGRVALSKSGAGA
jgi:SAM-dependent methyltransferase